MSADSSACGAYWAPCADLAVALAAAAASGATFTEAAPAELVFLPGEHARAGNCGAELGAAMPVRVSARLGLGRVAPAEGESPVSVSQTGARRSSDPNARRSGRASIGFGGNRSVDRSFDAKNAETVRTNVL